MFPHPLLMARLGAGLSNLRNEGLIQELEQEVLDWQRYSADLEYRLDSLVERYNELLKENDRLSRTVKKLRSR